MYDDHDNLNEDLLLMNNNKIEWMGDPPSAQFVKSILTHTSKLRIDRPVYVQGKVGYVTEFEDLLTFTMFKSLLSALNLDYKLMPQSIIVPRDYMESLLGDYNYIPQKNVKVRSKFVSRAETQTTFTNYTDLERAHLVAYFNDVKRYATGALTTYLNK